MAYPFIVFAYGKSELEETIRTLIRKYSDDYKALHEAGKPVEFKIRMKERSEIALLMCELENIGAFLRLSGRLEGYGMGPIPAIIET